MCHFIQFFCRKSGFGNDGFLLILGEAVILNLRSSDADHVSDFIPEIIRIETVGAFARLNIS